MLFASKQRAKIYLASATFGYFLFLIYYDAFGLGPSCLLALSNLIEIIAGYWLIQRYASKPLTFHRLRSTLELISYGVLLNSIIGATVGTILMDSIWESSSFTSWMIWFGTAAIGYLMVLPLFFSWFSPHTKRYTLFNILEAILLISLSMVGSFFLFSKFENSSFLFPYIAFPILLWSSIRFELRLTSIAVILFLVISAISSSQGLGPFAIGEFNRDVILIRFILYCGITLITVLIASALVTERQMLLNNIQDAFSQIKTLTGFIPICSHCKKIRDDSGYWNHLEEYLMEHSDAELSRGLCPDCAVEHNSQYLNSPNKCTDKDPAPSESNH